MGFVLLDSQELLAISNIQKSHYFVKLRDLMAKQLLWSSQLQDEKLLRSLGFTQLIDKTLHDQRFCFMAI